MLRESLSSSMDALIRLVARVIQHCLANCDWRGHISPCYFFILRRVKERLLLLSRFGNGSVLTTPLLFHARGQCAIRIGNISACTDQRIQEWRISVSRLHAVN